MSNIKDSKFAVGLFKDTEGNNKLLIRFGSKRFHFPKVKKHVTFMFFSLIEFSLYEINFIYLRKEDALPTVKTLPLLSIFLGAVLVKEIPIEEESFSLKINKHMYDFNVFIRFRYYRNVGDGLCLSGSKNRVYNVKSETDYELFPHNFSVSEIENRSPNPFDVLEKSKSLYLLTQNLKEE